MYFFMTGVGRIYFLNFNGLKFKKKKSFIRDQKRDIRATLHDQYATYEYCSDTKNKNEKNWPNASWTST